jgi:hypothetical protein
VGPQGPAGPAGKSVTLRTRGRIQSGRYVLTITAGSGRHARTLIHRTVIVR